MQPLLITINITVFLEHHISIETKEMGPPAQKTHLQGSLRDSCALHGSCGISFADTETGGAINGKPRGSANYREADLLCQMHKMLANFFVGVQTVSF